jgi:hypothetical protein
MLPAASCTAIASAVVGGAAAAGCVDNGCGYHLTDDVVRVCVPGQWQRASRTPWVGHEQVTGGGLFLTPPRPPRQDVHGHLALDRHGTVLPAHARVRRQSDVGPRLVIGHYDTAHARALRRRRLCRDAQRAWCWTRGVGGVGGREVGSSAFHNVHQVSRVDFEGLALQRETNNNRQAERKREKAVR